MENRREFPAEMEKHTLSVVMPAYNEGKTIEQVVRRVAETLENSGIDYQMIIVDDGSKDDTLEIARQKFPHSKVNLDALCKRFGVDNTSRTLHGALLDAQLLAEVYLELLGGQEPSMQLGENAHRDSAVAKTVSAQSLKRQFRPARDFPLSAEDLAAHEYFMTNKIKDSVWNAPLETAPAESK